MSPRTIGNLTVRDGPLLREDTTVGEAARLVEEAGVPALPVVDDRGRAVGVFGEREFISAIFPGYVGELRSARFVPAAVEDQLEKRASCRHDPVRDHMTPDHVEVGADYSDIELAETFLHHRVSIIPVQDESSAVRGFVTRTDFFRALWERLRTLSADS